MGMNNRLLRPRASGFDPRTIANLGLWLDASDTSSLTLNANTVSEWRDKSGNGRHFAQATAASQPNAVNRTQNGRRVLDFEGAQELLGNAASLNILRNVGGATIMAALQYDVLATISATRTAVFVSTNSNAVQARAALASFAPAVDSFGAGGRRLDANSFASVSVTITANQQNVAAAILDYANSDAFIYRNGSLGSSSLSFQTTGNTPDTDALGVTVGSGNGQNFMDGWLGEVLIWPRALSAAERAAAERYLGRKWGITVA